MFGHTDEIKGQFHKNIYSGRKCGCVIVVVHKKYMQIYREHNMTDELNSISFGNEISL